MRNIFDQYSQAENRVTHALMTAISEDRTLLGYFLRDLVKVKAPTSPHKLSVLEQQYPDGEEPNEDEFERRGIPDGWIFDDKGWCVFIETKVTAKLTTDQIHRHRKTAARLGFEDITAVAITPSNATSCPPDTVLLEWRNVYAWLRRYRSQSSWAVRAADYLEIAEAKLIDAGKFVEGTLTQFSGFPFGHDTSYTYREGKRVLGLALGDLRTRDDLRVELGLKPEAIGRPAITGSRSDAVWDFLSLSASTEKGGFTKHPHLTLGIGTKFVEATVTVPNAVNNALRKKIVALGDHGFQKMIEEIVERMNPLLHNYCGAVPFFRGIQRRYPSQKAVPFTDACIEFDLRTALPLVGPPKLQPLWLSAAYGSFIDKGGANYQIQVGVQFSYDKCPEISNDDALNIIAAAWIACKPLVDLGSTG